MTTDTHEIRMLSAATGEPEAPNEAPEARRHGTGITVLVVTAAAVVCLLVGAATGMLIGLPRSGQDVPPLAGSVDVGFAQDMSVHHLQAVTMASWARDHSTDPAIRTLAFDIESAQQAQVGMMTGWLNLWKQSTQPAPGAYLVWMAGSPAHGHGAAKAKSIPTGGVETMPGMATMQDIAKLRSLSGTELDVYFLQLALRHHEGGVPMARFAALRAGHSTVRTLAGSIVKSQTAEVDVIKSMLAQRSAGPLP